MLAPEKVFPAPPPGLERFSGFYAGERSEYVGLTVRQLRAGLLRLATESRGGGTVFPVAKAGGTAQRLVWHGTRVSLAAARPPAPRHLADPSVIVLLDLGAAARLRVFKRDCSTWFDQLALEPGMSAFFGRPRVQRAELLAAGLSEAELAAFGAQRGVSSLVPCSGVWPMGFSWSSCVAQEALLPIAEDAGLDSRIVLAPDASLPENSPSPSPSPRTT